MLQTYYNDGWCTSLPAIAVADLARTGKNSVFCGNNRGNLRAYAARPDDRKPRWILNLAGTVRSLTVLPRPNEKEDLLVVGSDSGYLAAFSDAGEKAWGLPVSSAILRTDVVLRGAGAAPWVAAGCKDGKVFLVDTAGGLRATFDCAGRLADLLCADLDGDGKSEVVAAAANGLWVLAPGGSVNSEQ